MRCVDAIDDVATTAAAIHADRIHTYAFLRVDHVHPCRAPHTHHRDDHRDYQEKCLRWHGLHTTWSDHLQIDGLQTLGPCLKNSEDLVFFFSPFLSVLLFCCILDMCCCLRADSGYAQIISKQRFRYPYMACPFIHAPRELIMLPFPNDRIVEENCMTLQRNLQWMQNPDFCVTVENTKIRNTEYRVVNTIANKHTTKRDFDMPPNWTFTTNYRSR